MTTPHDLRPARMGEPEQDSEHKGRGGGHGWRMITYCIPMPLIAIEAPHPVATRPIPLIASPPAAPEQMLAEHFARGEIDAEEYQRPL